jgi:hypothetical protein
MGAFAGTVTVDAHHQQAILDMRFGAVASPHLRELSADFQLVALLHELDLSRCGIRH